MKVYSNIFKFDLHFNSNWPHTEDSHISLKDTATLLNFSILLLSFVVCIIWEGSEAKRGGGGQIFHFIGADVQLPPCLHQSRGGCHGDGVPLLTGALRNNALLNSA